jgi:uncharacterized protein YkwD
MWRSIVPVRTSDAPGATRPAEPVERARRSAVAVACLLAMLCSLTPLRASADPVAAVNQARLVCSRQAALAPLKENRTLDAAAAQLAGGATLHAALATLSSHPEYAASMRLTGISDDRGIARALASRFCSDLGTPSLREVGIARHGSQLFVLVAAPLPLPSPGDRARVESEVLKLVNAARARPRRCGQVAFPAAPALTLAPLLTRVANRHSAAMAARDDLAHDDPDGSTPADRVRRAGYAARLVGENVAAGVPTAAEAVAGWLASPGHCSNIMDARFTEMGVAYAAAQHSAAAIYWTQLFAIPRA